MQSSGGIRRENEKVCQRFFRGRSFETPLRDYLDTERRAGRWNGDAPPPPLPASVVDATSKRYLDAYRRVTGSELKV